MTVTEAPEVEGTSDRLVGQPPVEPGPRPRLTLAAALPVLALIAIPTAIFLGGAIIAGHPLLSGDNLIQSYPLRVLVGTDLLHGHLPAWDPWIWSGTPLMAGLNAGAFYPTTLLFAIMNPTAAWIIGQIFMSSSIAVGTYWFFRLTGLGRPAAFLGAASFAFAGAVASQAAVHLDMGEGLVSLPWALIAIRKIIDEGRWRWSVLLAAATTLLMLAGSPEAMLDEGVMCLAYALLRLSLRPSAWARLASRGAGGALLGTGLSAFVWLPALHFISVSQRADVTSAFAATYAYPPRALPLGVLPYLEGGLGAVGQPQYFGPSNLPEVGFYVGLLPIVAALALCARRWKQWLPPGERRTWYGIALVGIVAAIAAGTPLDHLISHIPFYGRQRDQGRNIVAVDFAACALLAWWVDGGTRPAGARTRSEIVAAGAVAGVVGAIGLWLAISPSTLWKALHAFAPPPAQLGSIGAGVAVIGGLAIVALAIVLARRRMSKARWFAVVTIFVAADLTLFVSSTSLTASQVLPSSNRPGALMQVVNENLAPGGRYAVYDPDIFYPSTIVEAGEPDVGIVTDLPSVEGYGAIVDGTYSRDTGTHARANLVPNELANLVFVPLDLQVMVAPAEEFLLPIAALPSPGGRASLTPVIERAGTDPILPAGSEPVAQELLPTVVPTSPRSPIVAGAFKAWFFGGVASPTAAALVLSTPSAGQVVRVGLVEPAPPLHDSTSSSGSSAPSPASVIAWQPAQRLPAGQATVRLDLPGRASVGLAVEVVTGTKLGPSQLAIRADGHSFAVDGPLSSSLTPEAWFDVATIDHFTVFRADTAPVTAWAEPVGSNSPDSTPQLPATVHVVANGYDTTTLEARTDSPAVLTRSVAWDPGWRAKLVTGAAATADLRSDPGGGSLPGATSVPVHHVGLVQGVTIPAGVSLVEFFYEPAGFSTGLTISVASVAAGVAAAVAIGLWERRRRRQLRTAGAVPVPAVR